MKEKNNLGYVLYNLSLIIGLCGYYFMTTMFRENYATFFYKLITVSVLLMLVKILLFSEINLKEFSIFIGLELIFGLVFLNNQSKDLMFLLVYIFGAKNINFKDILKVYFYTGLSCTVITIAAALTGKIVNLIYYREGIERVAYGSIYPTNFAAHLFYLILAYVILREFNINLIEKLLILFSAYIVIVKCDARLDGYLLCLLFLATLFKPVTFQIVKKLGSKFLPVFMSILILLAIYISYQYSAGVKLYYTLNTIFTNRLSQGHLAFSRYSVTLFGQTVAMQGLGGTSGATGNYQEYFYIDNSFLQILMVDGLIAFIIIYCVYIWALSKYAKSKYYPLVIALLFAGISSIIDEQFVALSYNIFLLALMADKKEFIVDNVNKLARRTIE